MISCKRVGLITSFADDTVAWIDLKQQEIIADLLQNLSHSHYKNIKYICFVMILTSITCYFVNNYKCLSPSNIENKYVDIIDTFPFKNLMQFNSVQKFNNKILD